MTPTPQIPGEAELERIRDILKELLWANPVDANMPEHLRLNKAMDALLAWRDQSQVTARLDELKMARTLIPHHQPKAIDQIQGKTAYNEYIKKRIAELDATQKAKEV